MKNLESLKNNSNLFENVTSKNLLGGGGFATGWGQGSKEPVWCCALKPDHYRDDNWMSKYVRAAYNTKTGNV